jgi:hypothetical protein
VAAEGLNADQRRDDRLVLGDLMNCHFERQRRA